MFPPEFHDFLIDSNSLIDFMNVDKLQDIPSNMINNYQKIIHLCSRKQFTF